MTISQDNFANMPQRQVPPRGTPFFANSTPPLVLSRSYPRSQTPQPNVPPSSPQSSLNHDTVSERVSPSHQSLQSAYSCQSPRYLSPPISPRLDADMPYKPPSDDEVSLGRRSPRLQRQLHQRTKSPNSEIPASAQLSNKNLELFPLAQSPMNGDQRSQTWNACASPSL